MTRRHLAAAAVLAGHAAAIGAQSRNTPPAVTIARPVQTQVLSWGAPFRYAIAVTDREDGASASGEIPPHTIVLEVEYRRASDPDDPARRDGDRAGLDVLRTSNCFTCHADKTSLVGPSFAAIAERYGKDPGALPRLAGRIRTGSSGVWGSAAMPPHDDLSGADALAAARFVVEQGSRADRWVYAGTEGVVRVIDKPAGADTGTFVLTASYLDKGVGDARETRMRGEQTVTFVIR